MIYLITLYDHNEDGYNNLEKMLENERFATINHATGTGKSFIALKYLINHKKQRFLYIAPTYEIINQFVFRDMKTAGIERNDISVDTMIYRGLLNMDVQELYDRYDGFILDEYHRTGAPLTYKKILELKKLIESGKKDKKLIGLSATPVRYLDNERNMTEEVFNGNVASNISLPEGIVDGILPVPQYFIINGFLEEEYEKTREKVEKLYPSLLKDNLLLEIDNIERASTEDSDLVKLFSDNIKENGKYIYFSSSVSNLKQAMRNSFTLFEKFKDLKLYEVHSYMSKDRVKAQIDSFDNSQDGLNIMFAVDLFSEGIHPKMVDGVILDRSTSSPIIYFQQLGRTLTSSNINNVVQVFDLKSNYFSHDAIIELYNEIMDLCNRKIEENPEKKERYEFIKNSFTIVDSSNKYLSKLKAIRRKITYEMIILTELEYIIDSLELYIKENDLNGEISGIDIIDPMMKDYYFKLYEYREFINDELKKRLDELHIVIPNASHVTKEEKIRAKIDYFIVSLEEYLRDNNLFGEVITDFTINDVVLKKIYFEVLKNSKYITDNQLQKLKELNVLLTPEIMKNIIDNEGDSPLEEREENNVYDILRYIDSFEFEVDIEKDKEFKRMFNRLNSEDKKKVKNHKNIIFKNKSNILIDSFEFNQSMSIFVKLLRSCDIESAKVLMIKIEYYYEKIKYLNEFFDNQIKAQSLNMDSILSEFSDLLDDEDIKFLLTDDIRNFKISLLTSLKDISMKKDLCEYVIFCLNNKRRPVSKMDQDEIKLSHSYALVRESIPKVNFNIINNYLNSDEFRKGTTEQIVLNAKANGSYVRGKIKK